MNIKEIRNAIAQLEEKEAVELVKQAIDEGEEARKVLDEGVMAGLNDIGALYEKGEYFLAELVISGEIIDQCLQILDPHLPKVEGPSKGTVILSAVEGDLHDIGYGIVGRQLELAGYKVHGIGINVPSLTIIDKAKEYNADIIGLSAFLISTVSNCKQVIDYLRDMGIRDEYKVIIGGAETSQKAADEMGADGWGQNAINAVKLCDTLMGHI